MGRLLLCFAIIQLQACVAVNKKQVIQTRVDVSIREVGSLPNINGKPQLARATVGDGFCIIELTQYPKCLLHEIRHCFEGDWHKGKDSTKQC